MKTFLLKYKFLFLSLFFLGIYFFNPGIENQNKSSIKDNVNSKIVELETKMAHIISLYEQKVLKKGVEYLWENEPFYDHVFNIHIYKNDNDSLIYWNNNHVPVSSFADIPFRKDGFFKLQNGWYYSKTKQVSNSIICCSFLIKNEYPYENEDLINSFSNSFSNLKHVDISIDEDLPNKVFNKKKEYLFSIVFGDYDVRNKLHPNDAAFLFFFSFIVLLLAFLYQRFLILPPVKALIIPLGVFVGYLILMGQSLGMYVGQTPSITFEKTSFFSKYCYDIASFSLTLCVIIFLIFTLNRYLNQLKKDSFIYDFKLWIAVLFSFLLWTFQLEVFSAIILNSNVPFVIDHLFELNMYSFLLIALIGAFVYSYYIIANNVIDKFYSDPQKTNRRVFVLFLISFLYLIWGVFCSNQVLISLAFPLLIILWLVYNSKINYKSDFKILVTLFIISCYVSLNLSNWNDIKIQNEKKELAKYLASEKSIETEKEFAIISNKIQEEKFIQRLIEDNPETGMSDFKYILEGRYFKGYWDQYEISFDLFNSDGKSFFDNNKNPFQSLNQIIESNSVKSKYNDNLFYVKDFKHQLSYIAKQKIYSDSNSIYYLTAKFKSKKTPEGIGFPRLLISSNTLTFPEIDKYSIAKYHQSKLVSKHGRYSYASALTSSVNNKEYQKEGYSHYQFNKGKEDVIIVSRKKATWLERVTRFTYLFAFYGFILLFCYLIKGVNINSQKFKTLAFKIQAILVLIVFSSLLAFGWGSGVFVRNQYNKYTSENIREKLESLELELRAKLGKKESLSIEEQGNYMGIVLSKLSRVFITDINLYDPSGHLLSSSQPKVFNYGLMSEQINANAFYMLRSKQKSDFSQQEVIGNLKYISAYLPFYNSKGKLLAYVNLQHFGQQQDLETQIQKFLVSIINVFILLLVISIIISVIVSNWVTKPLRLLQKNISNIQFGLGNQKITYHKDDEIGALAQQYNQKLEELADTAEQLAKSERESAWRDMAKQVAHEIKNPLTPMKLSIQQLIRVFEKSDTESYKKLERVTTSLIEQIDGLTKIANEFSNFAKMPLPENEKLNLVDLLKNVISLFNQENNIQISFSAEQDPSFVFADKDQIIRVFNNLIKNAIQAISVNEDGLISIKVVKEDSFYRVSIEDNGFGIDPDQKEKIFVPYFTTKTTGTGIGLPIAKQIIENHNGDISFTSSKESGTVFTVILPICS